MGKLTAVSSLLSAPRPRLTAPPKLVDPFYRSPEWHALMKVIKRERGEKCEDCKATRVKLIGDHVDELKDGGARLDKANVRLRCLPCQNIKTAKGRAARVKGR